MSGFLKTIRPCPKISEDVRRFPNISEVFPKTFQTYLASVPGRALLNMTSSRLLFLSKLLDFGESIVIYSFYTEFSFLALVRVNIFLESVPVKVVITQLGVRNWLVRVSWREFEFFNSQA